MLKKLPKAAFLRLHGAETLVQQWENAPKSAKNGYNVRNNLQFGPDICNMEVTELYIN